MKLPDRSVRVLLVVFVLTVLLSTTPVAAQPEVIIESCSWWNPYC